MLTPFDWQEGIGRRAQYVEGRLSHGAPAVAISLPDGILIASLRRQSPKIYEVYDRMAMVAIGQQSDIEALRVAAVDWSHQEGFNRGEAEVTIQRLVTGLSTSLKRSFSDFNTSPLTAISLFVEVGDSPADDRYFVLQYDGDYEIKSGCAALAASPAKSADLQLELEGLVLSSQKTALARLEELLTKQFGEEGAAFEAVLVSRSQDRENRFTTLPLG